jgi:hypothetical protein
MKKLHSGCFINKNVLNAIWSEIYVDPKLDSACYIVRVLFINNPTILTVASCPSKKEADKFIRRIMKDEENF